MFKTWNCQAFTFITCILGSNFCLRVIYIYIDARKAEWIERLKKGI